MGTDRTNLEARLSAVIDDFASAEEETREQLLAHATLVRLQQGHFIFHAGDPCKSFLILLEGEVRVRLLSAGGREITLYRIEPGHVEHRPSETLAYLHGGLDARYLCNPL